MRRRRFELLRQYVVNISIFVQKTMFILAKYAYKYEFYSFFGKFTLTFSLKLLTFYMSTLVSTEKGLKSSILEFMLCYH